MSDINQFAKKMMQINQKVVRQYAPRAIFGSVGDLPQSVTGRAPLRVGMWPCTSEQEPELAMGLWAVLAYLLDQWTDIEVYRLFVQFDEDDDSEEFSWDITQSQFALEDWPVDPLDENIALWGTLRKEGDEWQLTAWIENDLLTGEDTEAESLSITADTPEKLVPKLPELAQMIADNIDAGVMDAAALPYNGETSVEAAPLKGFFGALLTWEAMLLAYLWDFDWDDEEVLDFQEKLLEAGEALGSDFAAWVTANAMAQAMRPGYVVLGELLVDEIERVRQRFADSPLPVPILAEAVYGMGYVQEAFQLLREDVQAHPTRSASWMKLGDLYARSGRVMESVGAFQTALENEATGNRLYRMYGNVLLIADQYGTELETFLLIDPDEKEEPVVWEAIEAYQKALELDPKDRSALHRMLTQLVMEDVDGERFWEAFRSLLKLENSGDLVRDIIDEMYEFDDITPGVEAIQALLQEHPQSLSLHINLASLYLAHDEGEEATSYLEKAKTLTDETAALADIERLLLAADDPEFEQRFGELVAIVEAGNALRSDDVEFLEMVMENAPNWVMGYLTLARAYNTWGDRDAALEVLLDAQEKLPDNPDILNLLAQILWDSGERELAFNYLNRGLKAYPFYVPLLARTGRYLFENGQIEESKQYLSFAEEIAPRDPDLQSIRTYIARRMAENPDLYQQDDE